MRVTRKAPLWAVVLAIVGMQASCNVRLGPFLAQLKDGPFANEIGAGGILALAIAGNYFDTFLQITPDSNSRLNMQGRRRKSEGMKQLEDQLVPYIVRQTDHC